MRVHTAPSPAWRAAPAASHTTWAVIPVTEGPLMSPCFSCTRRKLKKQWQKQMRGRGGGGSWSFPSSPSSQQHWLFQPHWYRQPARLPGQDCLLTVCALNLWGPSMTTTDFCPKCRAALAWPCTPSPSAKQYVEQLQRDEVAQACIRAGIQRRDSTEPQGMCSQ